MYASNLYTIYLFPFHFRNCSGYRRVTNSIVHDSRRPIHNKNNRRVLPLRTSPRSVPPRTRNRIREAVVSKNPDMRPPPTVTQAEVEFFSHLRIEAAGEYNWLNGLVCIGVMTCEDDRIIIDAYYLTNFEGVKPENVMSN